VSVKLKNASLGGTDVVMNIDRDAAQVNGYTGTYAVPQTIEASVSQLTATFYAQAGEGGAIVGTATASVSPNGTTLNLANFVLTWTIKTVQIQDMILHVAEGSSQLNFTALDAQSNVVAVSRGSAIWAIVSGGSHLTLTKDGIANPVAPGLTMVTATV